MHVQDGACCLVCGIAQSAPPKRFEKRYTDRDVLRRVEEIVEERLVVPHDACAKEHGAGGRRVSEVAQKSSFFFPLAIRLSSLRTGALVGRRVGEALGLAGLAADQAVQVRALLVAGALQRRGEVEGERRTIASSEWRGAGGGARRRRAVRTASTTWHWAHCSRGGRDGGEERRRVSRGLERGEGKARLREKKLGSE